jgi:hypothetical protein
MSDIVHVGLAQRIRARALFHRDTIAQTDQP